AAVALARVLRVRGASLTPLAAMCLLAALTRPEGLATAVFLAVAVIRRGSSRAAVRPVAIGFVAPLAALFAARMAYYGDLLPNTFYAKSGGWNVAHLQGLGTVALGAFGALGLAAVA